MLVMRFLTNKQVFKTSSWYMTQTFWWKSFKKHGKRRGGGEFSTFLFYLKETQMMPICKISYPRKMKTKVQNVFKLVKDTLPFKRLHQTTKNLKVVSVQYIFYCLDGWILARRGTVWPLMQYSTPELSDLHTIYSLSSGSFFLTTFLARSHIIRLQ